MACCWWIGRQVRPLRKGRLQGCLQPTASGQQPPFLPSFLPNPKCACCHFRPACCRCRLQVQKQYPQLGELAAMLEEGVLEKAARGMWGTSSKEGRYSK